MLEGRLAQEHKSLPARTTAGTWFFPRINPAQAVGWKGTVDGIRRLMPNETFRPV
jgi:hypothetical protein